MAGAIREWVTFADPSKKKLQWQVDVTFLTSKWTCIFGAGCQGVLTERAPELTMGCCSYGAYFSSKKDRDLVVAQSKKLSDDEWQFASKGRKKGIYAKDGKEFRTRLVDDACIFLNRVGWKSGPGCALHQFAERTGQHHSDVKPEVCWQLPLHREDAEGDDGITTAVLSEFARTGWGEGGEDFAWWCTEAPEAFVGDEAVYRSLEPELRKILGNELFETVAAYLDARQASGLSAVVHPAQVPIVLGATRNGTSGSPKTDTDSDAPVSVN